MSPETTAKRGRKYLPDQTQVRKRIARVCLTDAEYERLERLRIARDLSMSDMLRLCVLREIGSPK